MQTEKSTTTTDIKDFACVNWVGRGVIQIGISHLAARCDSLHGRRCVLERLALHCHGRESVSETATSAQISTFDGCSLVAAACGVGSARLIIA